MNVTASLLTVLSGELLKSAARSRRRTAKPSVAPSAAPAVAPAVPKPPMAQGNPMAPASHSLGNVNAPAYKGPDVRPPAPSQSAPPNVLAAQRPAAPAEAPHPDEDTLDGSTAATEAARLSSLDQEAARGPDGGMLYRSVTGRPAPRLTPQSPSGQLTPKEQLMNRMAEMPFVKTESFRLGWQIAKKAEEVQAPAQPLQPPQGKPMPAAPVAPPSSFKEKALAADAALGSGVRKVTNTVQGATEKLMPKMKPSTPPPDAFGVSRDPSLSTSGYWKGVAGKAAKAAPKAMSALAGPGAAVGASMTDAERDPVGSALNLLGGEKQNAATLGYRCAMLKRSAVPPMKPQSPMSGKNQELMGQFFGVGPKPKAPVRRPLVQRGRTTLK